MCGNSTLQRVFGRRGTFALKRIAEHWVLNWKEIMCFKNKTMTLFSIYTSVCVCLFMHYSPTLAFFLDFSRAWSSPSSISFMASSLFTLGSFYLRRDGVHERETHKTTVKQSLSLFHLQLWLISQEPFTIPNSSRSHELKKGQVSPVPTFQSN